MASPEIWARRVSEWRASGLTSVAYCRGKPFTAGGLRHWAHRLGRVQRQGPASVRLARIVRISELRSSQREPSPAGAVPEALVIEVGVARVAVRPGFDRATLAGVLEVLATVPGSTR